MIADRTLIAQQAADLVHQARALACAVHQGLADKGGVPYWRHLERVAERCQSPEAQAVGWLHDAVEDTELTMRVLHESGFPSAVCDAVALLTHDTNEPYRTYVDRIASNCTPGGAIAREVKIADLLDNMDPRRREACNDPAFIQHSDEKHWPALQRLLLGSWPA